MNREIKFRGKHSNKWIYGYLLKSIDDNKCYISVSLDQFYQVKEETISQYTGLKDKNGAEIYEGDIIEYKDSIGKHIEEVKFDKGCFYAGLHGGSSTRVSPKLINTRISKVIGNIYENEVDVDEKN